MSNDVFSDARSQIEATVPGATAPCRCLAANDAAADEVMFTGGEGPL